MKVTTKELRVQPGKILEQVLHFQEITITFRGKPLAKIIPYSNSTCDSEEESMFGIWKEHGDFTTVEEHVRNMRTGRLF